jgi:gamma-glutamyltranspeptidase/glutathione hydrolase
MNNPQVQNWTVRKPVARGRGGVVASQNMHAARAGAEILKKGGTAIDAAIATGACLAALEPWNSGLGGIGFMMIFDAKSGRTQVLDCGPVASRNLDPSRYPLTGAQAADLFGWPGVVEDRNVHGPLSMVVPSIVEGWRLAHATWGARPWAELFESAIGHARQGLPADWWTTLKIAGEAAILRRYPSSAAIYLPDGLPAVTSSAGPVKRVVIKGLAATMERLAAAGARDFYEGELARRLVADFRSVGCPIDAEDLAACKAVFRDPIEVDWNGAKVSLASGLTAGPTFRRVLENLPAGGVARGPGAAAFMAYADALRRAYAERLEKMGDENTGATHTTHLCAVDRHGNMIALTQTLLSLFGSRLVLPETGVLVNNVVMWFDPRPGRPNSMAPAKRPLTNMCPTVATRNGKGWFAIGASGGRKILPAVFQFSSFLIDHGMDLETAAHHPRIDVSDPDMVTMDPRLAPEIRQALSAQFPTRLHEYVAYPTSYACPQVVLQDGDARFGVGDVMSPWSAGVSEDEV